MTWFEFWLTLHILGALAAFGPTFAFGVIGARGGKEPQHARFATETVEFISTRMTIPIGLFVGITGVVMIFVADIDLWANEWLIAAIVLYLIALVFSLAVMVPVSRRMIAIMREMSPGPPPEGASGPPPQLAGLIRRTQMGGALLTVILIAIVVMMVAKPGL